MLQGHRKCFKDTGSTSRQSTGDNFWTGPQSTGNESKGENWIHQTKKAKQMRLSDNLKNKKRLFATYSFTGKLTYKRTHETSQNKSSKTLPRKLP